MLFTVVATLLAACLLSGPARHGVDAECCFPLTGILKCEDCTSGAPYCPQMPGDCNVFGCECRSGCLKGPGCPPIKDVVAGWIQRAAGVVDGAVGSVEAHLSPSGRQARGVILATGLDVIRQADRNDDGKLDAAEADAWLQHHNHAAMVKSISSHFDDVDVNRDGLLEPAEIDGDLLANAHGNIVELVNESEAVSEGSPQLETVSQ